MWLMTSSAQPRAKDNSSMRTHISNLPAVRGLCGERIGIAESPGGIEQAPVVIATRWTASQVCGEAWPRAGRLAAGELLLNVLVQHLEPSGATGVADVTG